MVSDLHHDILQQTEISIMLGCDNIRRGQENGLGRCRKYISWQSIVAISEEELTRMGERSGKRRQKK